MTDYEAIITARDIQMRDNPSWIEIRKLVQKHESKIEDLEKENAELKALNEKMSERIERLEGYERIVKKLQDNGFDTFISIKDFCKGKIQLEKEVTELRAIIANIRRLIS